MTYRNTLVAAIELKSQVGSIGNNFNNRTEEAIGNAVDVWKAHEEGAFGRVQPWLGFVFVAEHSPVTTRTATREPATLYDADPIFQGTSYLDRYAILGLRLMRERLYDAVAVIATAQGQGIHSEPYPELSVGNFVAAIEGRIAYIDSLDRQRRLP